MAAGYKRKIYVIKKSLQYRFIAWVVGTAALAAGIVLLDVLITLHRRAQQMGLSVRVGDLYDPTDPLTIAKLAVYVAGVFLVSVLLSHRVAGPVYRIEKTAGDVSGGDLTSRVFFRQQDELVELRDAFNVMVDSLRGKVAGDVSCAFRAKKQLESLLEEGGDLSAPVVEKLKRAIGEMERVGKDFRI